MKRIGLAIVGSLLIILALGVAALAAIGWSVIGRSGELDYRLGMISATETVVLVDLDRLEVAVPYIGDLGEVRLAVEASDGNRLFLGAAPTPAVDEYLRAVPYAVAYRDGMTWKLTHVPGGSTPSDAASSSDAPGGPGWLASDTGPRPAIIVPAQRPMTVVVSSDRPLGDVALIAVFSWPNARQWVLAAGIGAAVILIAGAGVLALALIRYRPRRSNSSETP